jgi:outer membrane protein assembly factor BamA
MIALRVCRPVSRSVLLPVALLAFSWLTPAVPATGQTPAAPADSVAAVPQRDAFDVVHDLLHGPRIEPEVDFDSPGGLSWVALPSISYNPLYGFAFGVSANAAGRLGDPKRARISALSVGGNYSTTGQTQIQARGDLFLNSNNLLLRVDGRYLDTSRPTWGLGPVEADQQEYDMDFRMNRLYCTALWQVSSAVYAGFGFHRDEFYDIVDVRAAAGESTPYTIYSGGPVERSASSGFSVNLMNDERDNPVNPRGGYYLSTSFRAYALEDDKGTWQEMLADFRAYPHVPSSSRNRLCFWVQTWFSFGKSPYLNLPHVAGDTYSRSGRGYVLGRIRSRNLASAEVEYRFDLRADGLLGAVAFGSLTAVTDPETGVFSRPDRAGGVGLRIKFSKKSDTNLTVDAGWGEHGSFGMFLGTTEAF